MPVQTLSSTAQVSLGLSLVEEDAGTALKLLAQSIDAAKEFVVLEQKLYVGTSDGFATSLTSSQEEVCSAASGVCVDVPVPCA